MHLPSRILLCFIGFGLIITSQSCRKFEDTRQDGSVIIDPDLKGSLQNPAWSPDGTMLVFTCFKKYNIEPSQIMLLNISDKSITTLVSDGSGNVNLPGATWNGQTGKIVFSSSREPHDEIYCISSNGSSGDEVMLTSRTDKMAYEPSFSPNGDWVVFESHMVDMEDNGILTIFPIDTAGNYCEITASGTDCRQPNWSSDGNNIVYQKFSDGGWDLWLINPDGSNNRQLTNGAGDKTDASFSPDGQWIVYSANHSGEDFANIYIIPVAGGTPVRVTNYKGYDGAPSWSPDGTTIVFESCPGEPDGSRGTKLYKIAVPPH